VRVLIDYRPALRARSGAGEYAHQLVRALLRNSAAPGSGMNVEVSIFSSSWKDRLQLPDELGGVRAIDRRVPVSVLNFAWHRLGWPSAETLTGAAFDVAHSPHPLLLPTRAAAQVVTIHDLNFLSHPERTSAEIRRDYPSLVRSHAHQADRILVPSRFTAGEVERLLDVPSDRITICSPGAPDWAPRAPGAPGASTPDNGYILFLGTLEPRKNVGTLLDAYERLLARPGLPMLPELVLAGRATDAAADWLERLRRPPLAGRVRHIGYVDPADRQRVYEGAFLLVQPSYEEGFGIPVLEAMTLGVPVVAANRGALPEVAGDAALLVDPHDAEAMAAAIARLIQEPPLAAANAARGIERSRLFQWSSSAERALEGYELAIRRRRERRQSA
jgi:glycosyltransferase involved in cell wall biosynthesis